MGEPKQYTVVALGPVTLGEIVMAFRRFSTFQAASLDEDNLIARQNMLEANVELFNLLSRASDQMQN